MESQAGGSNFLGLTINVTKEIKLSENRNIILDPSLGFGFLLPGWDIPTNIIHAGLNFKLRRLGLGIEGSWFINNLFVRRDKSEDSDFIKLLIYPNVNYTFIDKKRWYLRVSTGAYFAFDKQRTSANLELDHWKLAFAGDVIPGAGINIGYKFGKH